MTDPTPTSTKTSSVASDSPFQPASSPNANIPVDGPLYVTDDQPAEEPAVEKPKRGVRRRK